MIIKEWSGLLVINGVEASINAYIEQSGDGLIKWYGMGCLDKSKDIMVLRNEFSISTEIGELDIIRIGQSDNTFSFCGKGDPQF